jgi:hypothetical protein
MGKRVGSVLFRAAFLVSAAVGVTQACDAPQPPAPGRYDVTATPIGLNQPVDAYVGSVTPEATAPELGMFTNEVSWPVIPIHATLQADGRLLTWGSPVNNQGAGSGVAFVDTGTGALDHAITPTIESYDGFCNGLGTLTDGRYAMVGGNSVRQVQYYDPATRAQAVGPGLDQDRWYASVIRRPDDQLLVLGGAEALYENFLGETGDDSGVALTPVIGDGVQPWRRLDGATSSTFFGAARNRWWYPRAYNAPDGRVFGVSYDRMWYLDPGGSGSVVGVGQLPFATGASGSSVMYDTGKLLFAGGGQVWNGQEIFGTNQAAVIDINAGTPAVAASQPMAERRNWHNLTVLANGEVLVNGGTRFGFEQGGSNGVYQAEIWSPTFSAWRPADSAARVRTYHSTSLLLPSGAVFTGGGGNPGPETNLNAEWYLPPYLFARDANGAATWAWRPQINSIAGSLTWGGQIELGLTDDRPIASASLISAGSVTHSSNADQRRISLTFTQNEDLLSVSLPSSANSVPPGTYLLQVVDANGTPSPSQLVTFNRNAAGTVTVFDVG